MAKLTIPLTVVLATGLTSATSLYLTTQSTVIQGKQGNLQNQLLVYDTNSLNPCTSDKYQSFCGVAPIYNASEASACSGNYTGTQNWSSTTGIFRNNQGLFVNDGVVGATAKNGSGAFAYNVTNNSHCKSFSCTVKSSDGSASITWGGFRCTV